MSAIFSISRRSLVIPLFGLWINNCALSELRGSSASAAENPLGGLTGPLLVAPSLVGRLLGLACACVRVRVQKLGLMKLCEASVFTEEWIVP